jgi:hypothetical protein
MIRVRPMPRPLPRTNLDVVEKKVYSIRGTVIELTSRKIGWWIFGKKYPAIKVRINEVQLNEFNRLANEQMGNAQGGHLKGITSTLDLLLAEKSLSEFPVGAEVGITFEYSPPDMQFFLGRDPLRVDKFVVIGSDTQLENEI